MQEAGSVSWEGLHMQLPVRGTFTMLYLCHIQFVSDDDLVRA